LSRSYMFWSGVHLPLAVMWLRDWTTVQPLRLQCHATRMSEADTAASWVFRRHRSRQLRSLEWHARHL